MNYRINKKGQEEMFGFVIIIIIIIVIGMIMLAFSFKQTSSTNTNQKESEINDLIVAILSYTTECKNNLNENMSIKELIKESEKNNKDCKGTNELYSEYRDKILLDLTEKVLGNETKLKTAWIKGYQIKIIRYDLTNKENAREILSISKGNLSGSYFTSQAYPIILQYGETADFYMKIYYRN